MTPLPCVTFLPGTAWKMPFDRRGTRRVLDGMARAAGLAPGSVELTVTDDAHGAAMNERHLGCRGPTNILSFPAPSPRHGESGAQRGGQLLLCADALHRECLLYGQDPAEHAIRLLAHGLSHLAGLDHGPDMDRLEQAAQQAGQRIFRELA